MDIKETIRERLKDTILDWQEKPGKRIYIRVKKEEILPAVEFLFKELGLRFSTATATDMPEGLELLYHFSFDKTGEIFSLRVMLEDKKHPEIDSITPIFAGAEWIEREIWEMMGINFRNHPNLKRLLLAEDWPEGDFPLRQERQ